MSGLRNFFSIKPSFPTHDPTQPISAVSQAPPTPSRQWFTHRVPSLQQRSRMERLTLRALVALALLLGALLRLWQINQYGVNSDEAVYLGQAAALAHDPVLSRFFPLFRAHPLLFPFFASLPIHLLGLESLDLIGRLLAVLFGVGTIALTASIGRMLFGPWVGAIAALFLALMPYHVLVTRQALLDGPMTFWITLALFSFVRFGATRHPIWFLVTGSTLGLAILTKETAFIFVGAAILTLALHPTLSEQLRPLLFGGGALALTILIHPLSAFLAGASGSERTIQYLIWQLFRRPNHEWWFYLVTIPPVLGWAVVLLVPLGLWLVRHRWTWRETLLLTWILVPLAFLQAWPTKGFPYLVATTPAIALLAARTLARVFGFGQPQAARFVNRVPLFWWRLLGFSTVVLISTSLLLTSVNNLQAVQIGTFLAGSGGVPGGREAGTWIRLHTPEGAKLLTIGPSMANIIQFYGHRKAYGLSVSPNPLHRNPSYEPVTNPDLWLRNGELQYIVWDAYSANRSPFFAEKLLTYARRYHGRVIHTQSIATVDENGQPIQRPVIVIYEVRP